MSGEQHIEHGHSHSHSLREVGAGVRTPASMRYTTFALLALVALATLVGLVTLWPDYSKVAAVAERASFSAPGVTEARGQIMSVEDRCDAGPMAQPESQNSSEPGSAPGSPPDSSSEGSFAAIETSPDEASQIEQLTGEVGESAQNACQTLSVGLRSGEDAGQLVKITVRGTLALSGLSAGDSVELAAFPVESIAADGTALQRSYGLSNTYEVSGVVRHLPLALLAIAFFAVVIAVGRWRGFFSLLALIVAAGVLLGFVLPALIAGGPALPIALVGSSAIMFVTLYFVHGANMRSTSALIGTLVGVLIISALSWISVRVTKLSGLGDESSGMLSSMVSEIDFRGLLTCSILIAGLGVLNDVTISQASSVWELRAAAPHMPRREIYARAMRIGRDHIASTVYTVFFAYTGAALSTLIVLYLYNRPVLSLLTQEDIAIEVVRTLAGSMGLVLAVPITTWVAAMFVPAAKEEVTSPWREHLSTAGADPLRES